MAQNLHGKQSNVVVGLGTWTYTAPAAGLYNFSAVSTVIPASSLVIVINQNGTPIATSATPEAQDQVVSIATLHTSCAQSDVITIVLTSSAVIDNALNSVKTILICDPFWLA